MLLTSVLLLLCAALLHAVTNALMKKSQDKLAFAWWMLGVFNLAGFPLLFQIPSVSPAAWWIVLASGLLEAIYFFTLTRAYSSGDLSVVYPIARGSAPLFLLFWAIVFLKERPSWIGICGILLVVAGLYFINLPSFAAWSRPLHTFRSVATRWALLTGILISSYSAIDKVGVRYFPPLVYLYLILLVCWICLSVQWLFRDRRSMLLREIRTTSGAKHSPIVWIFTASLLGTFSYLLVLAAMRLSPVSYVGPVREISVVFGSIIGIRFLGEQGGSLRIIASAFVALGIILIAMFG
jgi:drug/metabolite transporter (DMT)-like permease